VSDGLRELKGMGCGMGMVFGRVGWIRTKGLKRII